ncbi:MAG: hypothetical protein SO101_02590 [Lachnospiraceae bacterium]|nr:hypothetical protein [Lachnospiraceae bacterium]
MANKNRIHIAILTGIIIILCIALGVLWNKSNTDSPASGMGLVLDDNASDWEESSDDSVSKGIQIPGYGTITVKSGAEKMEMSLVNPKENPCYFQFTLIVHTDDGDVTLYQSDLVEPGKAITEFDVRNLPPKGTYQMTVAVNTWSLEDPESAMNGAEVSTTLQVI